jgi:hypothetical protein
MADECGVFGMRIGDRTEIIGWVELDVNYMEATASM